MLFESGRERASPLAGQESGQAPGSSGGASSGAVLYSFMRSTELNAFSARLASRTWRTQHGSPHRGQYRQGSGASASGV